MKWTPERLAKFQKKMKKEWGDSRNARGVSFMKAVGGLGTLNVEHYRLLKKFVADYKLRRLLVLTRISGYWELYLRNIPKDVGLGPSISTYDGFLVLAEPGRLEEISDTRSSVHATRKRFAKSCRA